MNDFENLLNNIKRYVDLTSADEEALCSRIKTSLVKKKQFIVQPNFTCQHQTYVQSGTLRSYLLDGKGIEHTIQFAIDDWFISDFNSYITQSPATLFVEAIENTTIQQLSYEDAESLCLEHPIYERYFRLVAQKSFAFAQKRILSNLGKTAEERYLEFNQMYPHIAQRVPQYMLASYLGMSPEFLSKIRKRQNT